ncbi:hypothetical protein F4808DRAFT_422090 [Astrocystis sublimbata]|nr:hypothetical protein F4808DRAFT_422090 [Astrocystis sublimbata]
MSEPNPSAFDALQAHFRTQAAGLAHEDGDAGRMSPFSHGESHQQSMYPSLTEPFTQPFVSHLDPGHRLPISQTLPESSYLDPLLLAEDDYRSQLHPDPSTRTVEDNTSGLSRPSRNDLSSHVPQLHSAGRRVVVPKRKREIEDELIDPRLSGTSRSNFASHDSLAANIADSPGESLDSEIYPDPVSDTESETGLLDSTTDNLLQRNLALRQGLENESESEYRRSGVEDGDGSRRGRPTRGRGRGGRTRGTRRGPRKAVEPTGDVKYRISKAREAFVVKRFDEALEWVQDAIRINAEIYQAYSLLAAILEETGDFEGTFTAKECSCHLQPRQVEGWLDAARFGVNLLDRLPKDAAQIRERITLCYSAALRADPTNKEARHLRARMAVEKGFLGTAAKDYRYLLEHGRDGIYDMDALRAYAEITIILANTKTHTNHKPDSAIDWYRRVFADFRDRRNDDTCAVEFEDIDIFTGLLAYFEHTKDALYELKTLARCKLGRSAEQFWDDWQDDDREWDVNNERRKEFEDYRDGQYLESTYGSGLPLYLRTKMAVYRLKLGDLSEAQHHITHLDPDSPGGMQVLSSQPHLLAEVASALYESDLKPMALRFFKTLLVIPDVLDAAALLAAGRCYLDAGDQRQAEECFSAAIDADEADDEASIDARYELAKMYEAAREDQEAYILVNEAIRLQRVRDEAEDEDYEDFLEQDSDDDRQIRRPARKRRPRIRRAPRPPKPKAPKKPKSNAREARQPRPRRKVFGRNEDTTLEDRRRAEELALAWKIIHGTRESTDSTTQTGPSEHFMKAAKELVDDFRSCKGFYSWEKYLSHLGIDENKQIFVSRNRNLIEMRERLSHNLNPQEHNAERQLGERTAVSYRGVSFNEWLNLFLEYAVSLARQERIVESYQVCESARDAEVFAKNREDMFLIHITWAACALRARDEETCVAAARFLMRDRQFDSDPFRMFATLCRLCPSPASWYASGPVQKYMLRQIKLMDRALRSPGGGEDSEEEDRDIKTNSGRTYNSKDLDITLLVLYGHILFISNSFTYALNYFYRAHSIDPQNQMVLLSVGQCYIHYALKRQSENRQYLLIQGFVFLRRYYNLKLASPHAAERQEGHYNMARSYHAIGIPHLAAEYYRRVLSDIPDADADADVTMGGCDIDEGADGAGDGLSGNGNGRRSVFGNKDISMEAAFNLQQLCWAGGDLEAVKKLSEKHLTL